MGKASTKKTGSVIPLGKIQRAEAGKKKIKAPDLDGTPLGATGTQIYGGFFNLQDPLEYVADLRGQKAIQTYNRMYRSDAQVSQCIRSLKVPLIDAKWSIIEPGDKEAGDNPSPIEIEATKWLQDVWFQGEFNWDRTLKQITEYFALGFSCFEKLYRYDGKYIVPVKFCERLQDTIVSWNIKQEKLVSITQQIPGGETARTIEIPAEKVIMFVHDQSGDDYRGRSVLRPAYKHWFYKDTYYRVQGVQMERWAIGVPKIFQTDELENKAGKPQAIQATKNIRANEKGYVMMPKGWDVELLDAGNSKQLDLQDAIKHHNQEILKSVMAQFLELGMTDTGARSVGETHMGLFLKSLSMNANYICEVIRDHCFTELVRWNFGDKCRIPSLTYDGIKPNEIQVLAAAYQQIANSGYVLPDDKLEAHIRKQLGMPPVDEKTRRSTAAKTPASPSTGEPTKPNTTTNDPQDDSKPKAKTATAGESRRCLEGHKHDKKIDAYRYDGVDYEEPMSFYFWRALRATEEHIPWRSIVAYLDDSREKIVKLTREARQIVVDELNAKIAQAVKDGEWRAIDYSDEQQDNLSKAIYEVLYTLIDYGREAVKSELNLKPIVLKSAEDDTYAELIRKRLKFLRDRADNSAEISLDKLVDAARAYASSAVRTGVYDATDAREVLEKASERVVRDAANYNVTEAFNAGRTLQAEISSEDIAYAEYSAIMDQNTCGPCSQADSKQFLLTDPEYVQYMPPLSDCEGGSKCRCIYVYVSVPKPTK